MGEGFTSQVHQRVDGASPLVSGNHSRAAPHCGGDHKAAGHAKEQAPRANGTTGRFVEGYRCDQQIVGFHNPRIAPTCTFTSGYIKVTRLPRTR